MASVVSLKTQAGHVPSPDALAQPSRQYFPAGQGEQAAVVPLPSVEKDPGGQGPEPNAVGVACKQNRPAGQGLQLEAARSEYEPSAQMAQMDEPEEENDPAEHGTGTELAPAHL